MKYKMYTIGYVIPGRDDDYVEFSSRTSLMDVDIVVFAPSLPDYEMSVVDEGFYQGKKCYGTHGSFNLKDDINHWKNELNAFLKSGKTVFFLLDELEGFFINTGEKTHKASRTTYHVELYDNYKVLPFSIGDIVVAKGRHIKMDHNSLFYSFFKEFEDHFEYRVRLNNIGDQDVLFVGKNIKTTLGTKKKIGEGNFITLPYIEYDENEFSEKKDGEEVWTREALKFGKKLAGHFQDLHEKLTKDSKVTPTPEWLKKDLFLSKKEKYIVAKIGDNDGVIQRAKNKNEKLYEDLREVSSLKNLLFEKGTFLEDAVTKALKILGYESENYDDGILEMDQIITSKEGYRYIGECEGKDSKAVNITKFRQLSESLNADFEREEVEEKAFGILFGNPERLKDPVKRKLDFTEKCRIGAKRDKIALVKTLDLFRLTQYLEEYKNEKFKISCRKAIHDGLGGVVIFPDIPSKQKKNK